MKRVNESNISKPDYPTKNEIINKASLKGAAIASLATIMSVSTSMCSSQATVQGDMTQPTEYIEKETTACTDSDCTEEVYQLSGDVAAPDT
ncbi:MAG: hypothetical protein MJ153_05780 [Clostridia bacterium]|nr:hypothetical protein [Clostridia bacterium]